MGSHIERRKFLATVGTAAAWPLAARAQLPAVPVVGFLHPASHPTLLEAYAARLRAFHEGLKDAGFIEGQNVAIEYRWAEGQLDRLPALATELVRRQVAVIVADASVAAFAAKGVTTTIPIVFTSLRRSCRAWSCRQPRPAGRQPNGHQLVRK